MKKFISLFLIVGLIFTLTACTTQQDEEFDPSAYIKSILDSTYLDENDDYIELSGSSTEDAEENHDTTVYNLVFAFFEKYELNPSDSQIEELEVVFSNIYSQCVYEVSATAEENSEYFVTVTFTPIVNLSELGNYIDDIKEDAGDELYDVGASYIDDIIGICENAALYIEYGSSQEQIIDLIVNNESEIMLNITKLTDIDELIVLI